MYQIMKIFKWQFLFKNKPNFLDHLFSFVHSFSLYSIDDIFINSLRQMLNTTVSKVAQYTFYFSLEFRKVDAIKQQVQNCCECSKECNSAENEWTGRTIILFILNCCKCIKRLSKCKQKNNTVHIKIEHLLQFLTMKCERLTWHTCN